MLAFLIFIQVTVSELMMTHQVDNFAAGHHRDAEKTNLSLPQLIVIIINNRILISKVALLALIFSTIVSFLLPKIYSSTTLILPPQQDNGLMGLMLGSMGGGVTNLASDLLGKGTTADLYVGMLNSEAIMDTIIDRFKLMDVYDEKYRFDTYKRLDDNVDISAGKKDGIISITVEDKDPKRSADIANAYVDELGKLVVKLNVTGASQNKKFFEDRLAKTRLDLKNAEDRLKYFQSKNKALDLPDQAMVTIKGIADITAQLAIEKVKLAAMQRTLTESSQEVKNQKAVISNLNSEIVRLEGSQKNGAIPSIGSVPELGQEYIRLMRDFKIQETLLEMLTKQYELASLNEAKDVTGVQVIQTARVPDKKIKPKRSIVVLMSTFGTVLLLIIYLIGAEFIRKLPEEKILYWRQLLSKNSIS